MFRSFFSLLGQFFARYFDLSVRTSLRVWSALSTGTFNYGKILSWALFGGTLGYTSSLFFNAFRHCWSILKGVLDDAAFSSSFLDYASSTFSSFTWIWNGLVGVIPEALRFLLWWLGFDWWIWLGLSFLGLWFAGWLLDKFADYLGAIIERICQLL